jgi:Flagellar transcriptional activator (FlhC)
MRISDDRYTRDRLRLDLALRFIQHEARTRTIRTWTGLTDDRIRKLYRSYFQRPGAAAASRPRGRSPQQAAFFLRSPRLKQEAAVVASLCTLLGALPSRHAPRAGAPLPGFAQALALCEAYEAFRTLVPTAHISFEHVVYLHRALSRGEELTLASCSGCGGLLVAERVALVEPRCVYCADFVPEHREGRLSAFDASCRS